VTDKRKRHQAGDGWGETVDWWDAHTQHNTHQTRTLHNPHLASNKPLSSGPCQRKICILSHGHRWMCITRVLCPRFSVWRVWRCSARTLVIEPKVWRHWGRTVGGLLGYLSWVLRPSFPSVKWSSITRSSAHSLVTCIAFDAYSPHSKLAAYGHLAYTTPVRWLLLCLGSIIIMKGIILWAHKVRSYAFT
jgi:hypothetical protein